MARRAGAQTRNLASVRGTGGANGAEAMPITGRTAEAALEAWLAGQQQADLLRFITCGSVDDGKSTLIGRLMWEAHQIFDDQLAALRADSLKHGTQGSNIDFALLVDGLAAEREQGITIDVAYRHFATERRRFIVADTPGHEQYTRNMVTGASTANAALILVDATKGVLIQTRRHAFLLSLMGVRHVALAVNKIDLVEHSQTVFQAVSNAFESFAGPFGFETIVSIPLSALMGDNVTRRSGHTGWYRGPTLVEYLDRVPIRRPPAQRMVFPVQWVNRPDAGFRGYAGSVAEGRVGVGDTVRVSSSGRTAKIKSIVTFDGEQAAAGEGCAVTLTLDQDIDVSRGDVIGQSDHPIPITDQFQATVVWMAQEEGLIGRAYDLMLAHQWSRASITSIRHRINVNSMAHEAAATLALNDIAVCNVFTDKPLACDAFSRSKTLGGFILVDRISRATVAAGMIQHSLRRADNVHRQPLTIGRAERESLNHHCGRVIWFTGLSGAGKSTLANALEMELHRRGCRTYILDGDNVRQGLNHDLGFTDADRVENIRRVAEVAKLMLDAGLIVLTAFISPFRNEREMARELIGAENFVEVYVNTPIEVCEQRDSKGLYKKARAGVLPNLTGIGSPYEAPERPQFEVSVDISIDAAVKYLCEFAI